VIDEPSPTTLDLGRLLTGFLDRTLADRGLYLTELRADEADLETVFLELTGDASTQGTR
jgi:hypothetical protein